MRFGLALLAGAAAVEAHNGHHDRPGKWDWNGGYPYGGCNSQHLTGTPPKPGSLNATFAQLIDHSNPSLGTFEQFFFYVAKGVTEEDVNAYTGGWDITNTTRLIYVNGGYDPWRESGVSSSDLRPGGPLQSTNEVPVLVVPGGFHTSDLITMNGAVNAGAKEVIDCVVAQLKEWVGEWPKHGRYWRE